MKKLMTTACLFVVTIVAIVTFIAPTVFGQEKKTADVNPTPEAITARVDKLFAQWDKPDSPGCAVGVIRDGKLIYTRGYGLANLEYNLPLTSKSVLDIGSVSKQFTATSILLLAQQGKLSPDDDIRKYIPEIPAYTRPITIRQLLNHTSGIREYLALMDLASPDFTGRIESANALAIIARQKETNFPPGDESAYSNSGYFLLSVIVKRISGKTLREFAEVNIFAPLGMKNTHFHDAYRMIVPLRATGYSPATKGFRIAMSDSDVTGAGGLYTTIEDLLLWDQNFYHKKVGGQALQDELHRVGVLTNGEKLTYASGIVVAEYRGLPMAMHGGAWAGYRSMLLRFPQQSFSIVCLCNRGSATPWNLAYRVADEYLGELMTARSAVPTGVMVTEVELKQRSGLYRNVRTPDLRRIDLIDGTLAIAVYGDWKLTALDANRFIGTTAAGLYEVTFQPDSPGGGRIARMVEKLGDGKPTTRERIETSTLSVSELAAYAGTYYSEELDAVYEVAADKDLMTVTVRPSHTPEFRARPTYRDAFLNLAGNTQFLFERDAGGRIAAFRLHTPGVFNMRFVREPR